MERRIRIEPTRVSRWVAGFGERHGEPAVSVEEGRLRLSAPDGAIAELTPLLAGWVPGDAPVASLLTHVTTARRVGILLARKSAHAVGIAEGDRLVAHTVDRHYVQGRTKAGGWSQQRYARRRGNQAAAAYADAADDAFRILLPEVATLDALVCGGDAAAVEAVLADARLAPLADLRARSGARLLNVPDPRLTVLNDVVAHLGDIDIALNDLA